MDDRLSSKKRWWWTHAAVALTATLLIGSALTSHWDRDGGRDWDYFQSDLLSARHSLLVNQELPFWMPHRSGGHDAFADPQSAWLSPLGLLVVVFGFPIGSRLFLIGCAVTGALGAIQLGRYLRLAALPSFLIAVILFLSMPMGLYAAGGIPNFSMGLSILPWLTLLVLKKTVRDAMLAGPILGITLYNGDPNHFVWHTLYLAMLCSSLSVFQRNWAPLRSLVLTGLSTAVFALPKMLPMWLMLRDHPRPVEPGSSGGSALRLTYHALLHPFPPYMEQPQGEFVCLLQSGELVSVNSLSPHLIPQIVPGSQLDWVNLGCYVGWLTIILAIAGFAYFIVNSLHRDTGPIPSAILAISTTSLVFLWLSLGANVTPSLWLALHRLPVVSSMQGPSRLLVYTLVPLSIFAAFGLQGLIRLTMIRLDQQVAQILGGAVLSLLLLDVHLPTRKLYQVAFCEPPLEIPGVTDDCFQIRWDGRGNQSTLYAPPVTPAVRGGRGLVNGYTVFNPDTRVTPCSESSQSSDVNAEDGKTGVASHLQFTARSIRFEYQTDEPCRFTINQNWYRGWRTETPNTAVTNASEDDRISVSVPAGQGEVLLRYTPPGLAAGLWFSAVTIPLWFYSLIVLNRRQQWRGS